jgi:hypothetical protein
MKHRTLKDGCDIAVIGDWRGLSSSLGFPSALIKLPPSGNDGLGRFHRAFRMTLIEGVGKIERRIIKTRVMA